MSSDRELDYTENPLDQTQQIEFSAESSYEEDFPPLLPTQETSTGARQSRPTMEESTNVSIGGGHVPPIPNIMSRATAGDNASVQSNRSAHSSQGGHPSINSIVYPSSRQNIPLAPNFPGTAPLQGAQLGATEEAV